MNLRLDSLPLPFRHEDGNIRIGRSRVDLDLVVEEYRKGTSPEAMVEAYDTLELPDVYATIAFYLRNRENVDAYLHQREEERAALRREIEAGRPDWSEVKARLLARKAQLDASHVPPAHG